MIDTGPSIDHSSSCRAHRQVLDDVVANELDAASLARFEAHLAACADCRFTLAQARAYRRMMRRVGTGMRAPSSLRERALDLIRSTRGQ